MWHTHIHPSIHTHQIEINLKRNVNFKEGWGCSVAQWQNDASMHEILGSVSSTVSKTNTVEYTNTRKSGGKYANSRGLSLGKQGEGGSSHLTTLPHYWSAIWSLQVATDSALLLLCPYCLKQNMEHGSRSGTLIKWMAILCKWVHLLVLEFS